MTRTGTQPTFERQLIGLAVAACFAGIVHAGPTGPTVANGTASFATSGNTLTVTNTPGAIINWQAFSIRPDEVTRFIQSGAASAVLNRVTGPGQSAILGQLLSNGRVFLINPNGVVVGAGARIDTAGFVASSLNLSNEDFLAGRFRFTDPGNAGKVTNAGSINAHSGGPVYLIAPTVENHGVITAPNGDILLAAGKSVELVSAASPHLRVQVQAGGEAVNVGQLLADSGRVGLYGAAIRNAGTISADSASVNAAGNVVLKASRDVTLERTSVVSASGGQGGAVHLEAEQGTLLVEGRVAAKGAAGQGGDVKLLGAQVGLIGNAAVDASGAKGGGTVLVGGDYQGKNPEIQNAARVVLAPDAKITADATERGDGGQVIVWSDEYAGFYGAISARGGAAGGNGGFVETSSKDNLQAFGTVDAAAPFGRAGEWLLDPANVTISGGATANGTFSGGGPNIFSTTANGAIANVTTIQTSLNAGTSVTVNTTPGGTEAGDITVAAAVTKTTATGAPTLTLNASGNIAINSAVSGSAAGNVLNVSLVAGGNVSFGAGGSITTRNGTATVNAGTTATLGTIAAGSGALSVTSNGAITQNAGTALTTSGATTLAAGAANNITLTSATNSFGNVRVTSGNNVSIRDNTAFSFGGGASSISGNLTVDSNGNVTQAAAATVAVGGTTTINTRAANSDVTLNLANDFGGAVSITPAAGNTRNVSLQDSNSLILGTVTATGTLTAVANGAISDAGNLTITGATTLTAGAANSITLDNANDFGGAVRIVSGNNVTLNDVNALAFAATASAISGNLAVTTAGTVTQGAAGVTVGGTTSINAGAGNDITLNNANNNFGGAVSAGGRNVNLRDTNAMVLGTVTANGAGSVLTLQAGGSVTQTGVVTAPQLTATLAGAASALNLGTVANNVGQLNAVTAPGGVSLNNGNNNLVVNGNVTATNNAVSIATGTGSYTQNNVDVIAGTGAITVTADTVNIFTPNAANNAFQTSGALTLKPASAGRAMSLAGASGFDLTAAEVTALAGGATGPIVIGDAAASTGTMTIGAPVSFGAKAVTLNAGAFTDGNTVSPVTATSLALNARNAGASIGAAGANNALDVTVTNLQVNTNNGDAYVRATGALNLGPAASTLGTGGLNLTANGAITQSGAITATGTSTLAAGAANNITLAAANNFGTVAVTSGNNVVLNDVDALTLAASSVGTLTATAGGALNVNGALTTSLPGNSIVLSGSSFVNNVGAGPLIVPVGGRWMVYSTNPAGDTFNGLASGNQAIWNATFAGNPPGTIPVGNRYVFSMTGTPVTLTFTSTDAAKVYGDVANVSGNYAVSGFVNAATYGNVFTQDTAANTFTGAPNVTSAGAPAVANVGLFPITVTTGTLAATTGYTFAFSAAGQLTVSARPITVTPGPLARPYGDPNPATTGTLTVGGSGLVNGNTITQVDVTSPATATDPAGSAHALNASNPVFGGGGAASNYAITYAPGVLTISQRPISVLASDQARAYGDPNPTTGPFTITVGSLAGTDAIGSVNVTSPALSTSPAGSVWVLNNTGANFASGSASNYAITLQNGQLTIAQRPISVKANDQNRAYGDPNPATGPFTITAGTLAGTDAIGSVNVTSPALSASPAGSVWVLTNTGTNFTSGGAANYAITLQNGQLTIDPRAITVQANNQGRAYGDPNPTTGPYSITAGSLAGADSITNVNVTSPALVTSPVGPYALTPTAANFGTGVATNYAITFVDGVLTITPRPITVTANNQAKVYGQPDPTLTFTAPTVNGDVLAGTLIRVPGETVAGGPYAITQGTVTNASNPNYNITFVNGQLVITPAALTIAADNKTRLYGDANPPLTATFTGLTNGDTAAAIPGVTLTTPATLASNVGSYAINVASGANSNYTITYVNGQLVITPAPLTIAGNDAARRFGEPNPPFTVNTTGFKLGETVANLGGTLLITTPATVLSPIGAYPIVPSGVSSSNYTITFVDGRLLVGQGIPPADQALITAVGRGESTGAPWTASPQTRGVDCLVLERPDVRRVLNRCY